MQINNYSPANIFINSPSFSINQYNVSNIILALGFIAQINAAKNRTNKQIFLGDNFTENNQFIFIQKSDLAELNLQPDNTAESLLVALILNVYFVGLKSEKVKLFQRSKDISNKKINYYLWIEFTSRKLDLFGQLSLDNFLSIGDL